MKTGNKIDYGGLMQVQCLDALSTGFGWERVNFLYRCLCGAVFCFVMKTMLITHTQPPFKLRLNSAYTVLRPSL